MSILRVYLKSQRFTTLPSIKLIERCKLSASCSFWKLLPLASSSLIKEATCYINIATK